MENQYAQSDRPNLEDHLRGLILTNQQSTPTLAVEKAGQNSKAAFDIRPQSGGALEHSCLEQPANFSLASIKTNSFPISSVAKLLPNSYDSWKHGGNSHRHDISGVVAQSSNPHRSRASSCGSYRNRYQHPSYSSNTPSTGSLAQFPPLGMNHSWASSPNPRISSEQEKERSQHEGERHSRIRSTHRIPYDRLHAEHALHIDRLAQNVLGQIRSPHSEIKSKNELLRRLEVICRSIDPDAALIPFGSFVSKFWKTYA